jgi:hypothetical protein
MGKNLKINFLVSSVLLLSPVAAAEEIAAAASSANDGDWRAVDAVPSTIDDVLSKIGGCLEREASADLERRKFEKRRTIGIGDLKSLIQDVQAGDNIIRWMQFPEVSESVVEKQAEYSLRHKDIVEALELTRSKLGSIDDSERGALESDILRLVAERDTVNEQVEYFSAVQRIPELRRLLAGCHEALTHNLTVLPEIVEKWFSLMSEYAAVVYAIDDRSDKQLDKALEDLSINDREYNSASNEVYDVLAVINMINQWASIIKDYMELPFIYAEPVTDDEIVEESTFDHKQRLEGVLRRLNVLFSELSSSPSNLIASEVQYALNLLTLNADIDKIRDQLVLLRDGLADDVEMRRVEDELGAIQRRFELKVADLESVDFTMLVKRQAELEEWKQQQTARKQEIEDLERTLGETILALIELENADVLQSSDSESYGSDFERDGYE